MKFCYDIFPEQRTIVARYVGTFTFSELVAAAELMWSDPRYSRTFAGLVDLSHGSAGVEMGDFRSLLTFLRKNNLTSTGRWAAVASTPFATACSLMYQRAMAGRHILEIFSTWEAACEFLHVDLPQDIPLARGGIDFGNN